MIRRGGDPTQTGMDKSCPCLFGKSCVALHLPGEKAYYKLEPLDKDHLDQWREKLEVALQGQPSGLNLPEPNRLLARAKGERRQKTEKINKNGSGSGFQSSLQPEASSQTTSPCVLRMARVQK